MRQWRVGSFSMGLVLVLLGLGLLLDQFQGAPKALDLIIKWWPLVLILLGLEILAAGIFFRGEKIAIKYDFWSVLLVLVFFIFSMAAYALNTSGFIPLVQEAVKAREYTVSLPEKNIPLQGAERIVLSCPDGPLELRSSSGRELRLFGQGNVSAASEEEAKELLEAAEINCYPEGDTLYIQVNELPYRSHSFGWNGAHVVNRTILVPADMALELKRGSGYHTEIVLDDLAAPWSLEVMGSLKATLASSLDVTVYGRSNHPDNFQGSAPWSIEETPSSAAAIAPSSAAASFTLGEGTWPLHLAAEWDVEVDIR